MLKNTFPSILSNEMDQNWLMHFPLLPEEFSSLEILTSSMHLHYSASLPFAISPLRLSRVDAGSVGGILHNVWYTTVALLSVLPPQPPSVLAPLEQTLLLVDLGWWGLCWVWAPVLSLDLLRVSWKKASCAEQESSCYVQLLCEDEVLIMTQVLLLQRIQQFALACCQSTSGPNPDCWEPILA